MVFNTHALSYFRESAESTKMLSAKSALAASNVYVSQDIKAFTEIAQMKMNAVLEDTNAMHMQIAQTQWVLTSANAN